MCKNCYECGGSCAFQHRLQEIRDIIDAVENRCAAADGPVTDFREEVTLKELRDIYELTEP